MIAIKEEQTLITKKVSYSFDEANEIGRRHFKLGEEYACFELTVVDSTTGSGEEVLRASLGHEDITVDDKVYVMELPLTIEYALPTGQLEFDISN